jgi:GTP pyrophosphokinase
VLTADTHVEDYDITLHLEGTMDDFEYRLTSAPSLSQEDIISLLLTGQTLTELGESGQDVVTMGRETLERELKRMGVLDSMSFDTVSNLFAFGKLEDFLASIGAGDINASQIGHKILDEERSRQKFKDVTSLVRKSRVSAHGDDKSGVNILGTGGLLVNIARCCNPMPGDSIMGYITRGRGVTVHKQECPNIVSLKDPERLIDVSWGGMDDEKRFAVPVEIIAYDREGLMRDITAVIADEKINIAEVRVATKQEIATFHITMEITDNRQLTRILSKIEQLVSVVEAYRCNPA